MLEAFAWIALALAIVGIYALVRERTEKRAARESDS